jgi:LPS O-antigen subunit length determinant protein (WzzB/FepE family)
MAYKKISRNDAYMNVANVEDDEDVIDLLEVARAILKHIKLIILLSVVFGADFLEQSY